jgi:hypothetical protein
MRRIAIRTAIQWVGGWRSADGGFGGSTASGRCGRCRDPMILMIVIASSEDGSSGRWIE